MGNVDPPPPAPGDAVPAGYPTGAHPTTPSLAHELAARIRQHGPLPFPEFMATSLYHPQLGYYSGTRRRVGREGDFFTSVSTGPLFGHLLARHSLARYERIGRPTRWRLIECGADDGSLADDVLTGIQSLDPAALAALDYVVCEPLPGLSALQRTRLNHWPDTVRWVEHPTTLADAPLPGIAFGNEVLDALPCHLIEFQQGAWNERHVALADDRIPQDPANPTFIWHLAPITYPALAHAAAALGTSFENGHRTEIRTNFAGFLAPLAHALIQPAMLWIDYGFEHDDYHHPDRREGTLRTFHRHHAGDDPLADPGERDLTAHVDFTALAKAAESCGGRMTSLRSQGSWLTHLARPWLLSLEGHPDPKALRNFQTLTHPAHLGSRFHIAELEWPAP